MRSAESFFKWAFNARAKTIMDIHAGQEISHEKLFLSFCSHNPAFVSHGSAGLNASIKGVGFLPKEEYLEQTLEAYLAHIATYDPEDKNYSRRGLEVLIDNLYGEEARARVDFSRLGSLEMAKKHSWTNYRENPEATLIYYQPPAISYEVRGTMQIIDEEESKKPEIIQKLINAQHDVYHTPNPNRPNDPAYLFTIKEIYDNGVSKEGFGKQLAYPY
jgi:hypothetical protein